MWLCWWQSLCCCWMFLFGVLRIQWRSNNGGHMVTVKRLREILRYDVASGNMFWAVSLNPRAPVGALGGKQSISQGYRHISIDGVRYKAHHLVWLWFHGVFPTHQIDHINGNKLDNRIENLRDVPQKMNTWNLQRAKKNNKSGFLGVDWKPSHKKWRAQIRVEGKKIQLGLFDTAEAAHIAYLAAKASRETNLWRP